MNAVGLSILVLLIGPVLFAPRRWAALGMVAGVLFLTEGEAIDLFGINLYAIRFLEVAGFARVMLRKEFLFSNLNKIDRIFLCFYGYTTIIFLLRSSVGQAYMIGETVDAVLCYFTFRGLIQGIDDFKCFLSDFVILLSLYFLLVLAQSLSAKNPFAIVGGPESFWFRHGRPRCYGSFQHPDLSGSLGATFLPIFIGYALMEAKCFRAILGIFLCLGIVLLANSGGPVLAAGIGLIGWLLWPIRNRMTLLRRALASMLVVAALLMKAPIWYLPARAANFVGGDGWHRSYLMDVAFKHIDEWWLAGMPRADTVNWFPYYIHSIGSADITNQFLAFGISAGLGSIILFVVLLIRSFRSLGKTLGTLYSSRPCDAFMLWGLGVMLSVHIVNWIGVRYFDQFYVIWFLQLAIISSVTDSTNIALEPNKKTDP